MARVGLALRVPRWRTHVAVAIVRVARVLHPFRPGLALDLARFACAFVTRAAVIA